MTFLHCHLLGPHWSPKPRELDVQMVNLHVAAQRSLLTQLRATGAWQSGLLIGHTTHDRARVICASPCPPPGIDPASHALGSLDGLRQVNPNAEWLGMWCSAPDTRLPALSTLLERFEQGQILGLFAEQRLLLGAGIEDGALTCTALVSADVDLSPRVVPVTFRRLPHVR